MITNSRDFIRTHHLSRQHVSRFTFCSIDFHYYCTDTLTHYYCEVNVYYCAVCTEGIINIKLHDISIDFNRIVRVIFVLRSGDVRELDQWPSLPTPPQELFNTQTRWISKVLVTLPGVGWVYYEHEKFIFLAIKWLKNAIICNRNNWMLSFACSE